MPINFIQGLPDPRLQGMDQAGREFGQALGQGYSQKTFKSMFQDVIDAGGDARTAMQRIMPFDPDLAERLGKTELEKQFDNSLRQALAREGVIVPEGESPRATAMAKDIAHKDEQRAQTRASTEQTVANTGQINQNVDIAKKRFAEEAARYPLERRMLFYKSVVAGAQASVAEKMAVLELMEAEEALAQQRLQTQMLTEDAVHHGRKLLGEMDYQDLTNEGLRQKIDVIASEQEALDLYNSLTSGEAGQQYVDDYTSALSDAAASQGLIQGTPYTRMRPMTEEEKGTGVQGVFNRAFNTQKEVNTDVTPLRPEMPGADSITTRRLGLETAIGAIGKAKPTQLIPDEILDAAWLKTGRPIEDAPHRLDRPAPPEPDKWKHTPPVDAGDKYTYSMYNEKTGERRIITVDKVQEEKLAEEAWRSAKTQLIKVQKPGGFEEGYWVTIDANGEQQTKKAYRLRNVKGDVTVEVNREQIAKNTIGYFDGIIDNYGIDSLQYPGMMRDYRNLWKNLVADAMKSAEETGDFTRLTSAEAFRIAETSFDYILAELYAIGDELVQTNPKFAKSQDKMVNAMLAEFRKDPMNSQYATYVSLLRRSAGTWYAGRIAGDAKANQHVDGVFTKVAGR